MSALQRGGEEKAPMVPMMVTACLQFIHLNKVEHILVIVDHFMRYTRAYVTKDQKAMTTAKGSSPFLGHPKEYSQIKEKPLQVR